MNCPKCDQPLEKKDLRGERVGHCASCNGWWLETADIACVSKAWKEFPDLRKSNPRKRRETLAVCSLCRVELDGFYHDTGATTLLVERCPKCGGVWLDDGELKRVTIYAKDARRGGEQPPVERQMKDHLKKMGVWVIAAVVGIVLLVAVLVYLL
ncbi:MAG TPA: zf-TFIIB domain-containing protein [Spirochaetota bacterium]|nr:zf-TFIIB domain-containing protein [Spirochaetota bacterium]